MVRPYLSANSRQMGALRVVGLLIVSAFALWGLLDVIARLIPGGWPL